MSMIGKTLGNFEITTQIGRGGMGEVYQAKDQKLGRDVAIKVLPEEFARDADRVARFQREAKLLASLNHPNIAAIYGLEESSGTNFLVLELVEGDTLADRSKAGPIPVEEALKLALQIAEALEAAHEKGVIHRDLKPANIKVTPDGKVKVLDFGLAKAFAVEREEPSFSASPTLSHLATQQGIILGTAAYMSPEQAKGKTVDKRADIWAFGCVLYEMLTGQAAFQGEDVTEILAAVVKSGVNLDLLPANIHPRVREVIIRCLQKDLKKRYSSITEAQYEIERALADPSGVLVQPVTTMEPRAKLRTILSWVAVTATLSIIVAGVAIWNLKLTPPPEPCQVTWLSDELPKDQQFSNLGESSLAVSPDGRQIVYSTTGGLYLRSLDQLTAKLVPGSGGNPERPFFSPDGKWIGYFCRADSQLKKIAINGGTPVTLTGAPSIGSFSWMADDSIAYGQPGRGIMRISANGGNPEAIVTEEKMNILHPQVLTDGQYLLFSKVSPRPLKIMIQQLKSGKREELFSGDTPRYLPTGHIVYALGDNIFAVPFDLKSLKPTGGPVPVVENVLVRGGPPQWAISDSGTLAYVPGSAARLPQLSLVWVDRNGKEDPLAAPLNFYISPRISPDGTRVAMGAWYGAGGVDICVWSLARKTLTRLTFDPAEDDFPLWSPDGKRIAFYSLREGNSGVYLKAADGTGIDEPLMPFSITQIYPGSWSGDGKTLLSQEIYGERAGSSNFYIGILSLGGEHKWKPLLQEKYMVVQPRISSNGRWLAYTSNESGRNEIYVHPYPDLSTGKWQVSSEGGDSPLWSQDGHELFYRNGDKVMAVPVKTDPAFSMETPKILFRGTYVTANFNMGTLELNPWDISPDGRRFLMMKEVGTGAATAEGPRRINVVINWFEELKQRAPAVKK